MQLLYSQEAND